MIYQPIRGHSLRDVATALGQPFRAVDQVARGITQSGWTFAENTVRPDHVSFITEKALAELLVRLGGEPDGFRARLAEVAKIDRAAGVMTQLCDADDEAARRAFHDKVNRDRYDQPPKQTRPQDYSVPDHRVRLGLR